MSDQVLDQQLEILLKELSYPVESVELVSRAESLSIDQELLIMLRALPEQEYHSRSEIMEHLGEISRLPGDENLWS